MATSRQKPNIELKIPPVTTIMIRNPTLKNIDTREWDSADNKPDGHCFYHAALRFIYKNSPTNTSYLPNDQKDGFAYNYNNQQPRDVVKLRSAVNAYLESHHRAKYEIDKKNFENVGLQNAIENKATSFYAGDGKTIQELEFSAVANLLNVCMAVWEYQFIPSRHSYGWKWITHTPRNNYDCHGSIMYIFNINSNHMVSLFRKEVEVFGFEEEPSSQTQPYTNTQPKTKKEMNFFKSTNKQDKESFLAYMKIYLNNIKNNIKNYYDSNGNVDKQILETLYADYISGSTYEFNHKTLEEYMNELILKMKEKNQFGGKPKRQRGTKRTRQRGTKRQQVTKRQRTRRRRALIL